MARAAAQRAREAATEGGDTAMQQQQLAVAEAPAGALVLEEADDILLIDQLATLGINAGDIKKAKEAGYCTVKSLLMVPKKELWAIKGLSEAKVDKVLDAARKLCEIGFMTGNQFLEARKRVLKITTGVQAIDQILRGGFETACLTEIFGEHKTGKTQLCHQVGAPRPPRPRPGPPAVLPPPGLGPAQG